jgi:hypothetical protein
MTAPVATRRGKHVPNWGGGGANKGDASTSTTEDTSEAGAAPEAAETTADELTTQPGEAETPTD